MHVGNPVHRADDRCRAAVWIVAQHGIDRGHRVGGVGEGKAEFHAAGDPRTARPDQPILDDVVTIENFAMIDLVVDGIDVAAEVGQDRDLQIFVFEIDGAIGHGHAITRQIVEHGVRIDRRFADKRKCWIWIGGTQLIGRDGNRAFPAVYCVA